MSDSDSIKLCKCGCGKPTRVAVRGPKKGQILDYLKGHNGTHGHSGRLTHGGKVSPTYRSWMGMKHRCRHVKSYIERGTRVTPQWERFETFLADMGERPSRMHTLERIDNNGHYEPGNCRWATYAEQLRNTSKTKMLTLNGETKCVSDWAKQYGLRPSALHHRIAHGDTTPDRLFRPVRKTKRSPVPQEPPSPTANTVRNTGESHRP